MDILTKAATWTGVALTAVCGVVLLGGGKVTSGTLLIATAFVMVLPVRHRLPRAVRVALLCAVLAVVVVNVSTTELPGSADGMVAACGDEAASTFTPTGHRFLDQLRYILGNFLAQAAPS